MRRYIWDLPGWPELIVRLDEVEERLSAAQFALGEVAGVLRALGSADRRTIELDALADTALQTSEIEGEHLSADSVRASLARRLGLDHLATAPTDPRADGVVAISIDATFNAAKPLTKKRLIQWQTGLFPDAPRSLTVGDWRAANDPMRVVSGPVGARAVHFEAPPAARVEAEMRAFLRWFEASPAAKRRAFPPLVPAALAHLRFLAIHPFADGNGRVGRAIADLVLARADPHVAPYVSLSRQIQKERAAYYEAISRAQRSGLDATAWTAWFIDCYRRATADALRSADSLVRAARFWRDHADAELNARQRKVLDRYLAGDFEGWLNSRNYRAIAKTSPDTAQRDLTDLAHKKLIFANDGKARKTSYRVGAAYDPHTT